jgi:hypothetical protein
MKTLPLAGLVSANPLRKTATCPNCWHEFSPDAVLWISVHHKLAGEPQLPRTLESIPQKRFIPARFDTEGRALDSEGVACTQLACPRCRLVVPRAVVELPSTVFSVLGAPGSGKSVFLASMIFTMRQHAASLGLRFQDADLTLNKYLLEEERQIFLDAEAESYRPFDHAVKKTTVDGARYSTSLIDGQETRFAFPFTFLVAPTTGHPHVESEQSLGRLLCLYDNAGEHFLPGADAADTPMTRHLAVSKGLMYTFDPIQDRRFLRELGGRANPRIGADRQDIVLIEAANRIREHGGISRSSKVPQTLFVIVTKFDAWRSLLPDAENAQLIRRHPNGLIDAFAMDEMEALSNGCRDLLLRTCPEIVTAAESISDTVYYAPVAAVGMDVRPDPRSGTTCFRGATCQPFGVLAPLLALLGKNTPKLIQSLRRRSP